MRVAVFAFTRQGCETARRVLEALGDSNNCRAYAVEQYAGDGFAPIVLPLSSFAGPIFSRADAMVFVGACGIAVRAIATHIRDKRTDPAVLVVDELGRCVISLLSGHIGGANDLAKALARSLGATPVITTATDVHQKFSVDEWAARHGFAIDSIQAAKAVAAAILEGPVPLVSDLPIVTALPNGVVPGDRGSVGICISWEKKHPFSETLLLVPPMLHLGIGCRRGTPAPAIREAVEAVLSAHHIHPSAVKCAASIDLKADEPGLLDCCAGMGWPLSFYSAKELEAAEGIFTPSEFVRGVTGVDNVCERAAMLGADTLLVRKTSGNGVTVAVAAEHLEVRFG